MVKKSGSNENYRSFTIEGSSIGYEGSRIVSRNPGSAASKAATILFSLINAKEGPYTRFKGHDLMFILREQTIGSKHKTYAYNAKRSKLPEDKVVLREFPGRKDPKDPSKPLVVRIEYVTKVKALKEHQIPSHLKCKLNNGQ